MILPDVNVLVCAFRPDAAEHPRCNSWLQEVVDDEGRFGISPLSLGAVVRVTTNRRIWTAPSPIEDAFKFCDHLLAQPNCQIVEPGERHWGIFKRLCAESDIRGPLVADAWYAALAIEWGCQWVTLDRDYARFAGLKWRVPSVQ